MWFISKPKTTRITVGNQVFTVEVVETLSQKAKGLGWRTELPKDGGMLFLFARYTKPGFWMLGMKFPIDILWIKDNRVIGIEKNIPINDLKLYYPSEPINQVLEIIAGGADQKGITIGDTVVID